MKSLIFSLLITFNLLGVTKTSSVTQNPCSQCTWQWLDACCLRVKCENSTNYSVGVDGFGSGGYCHGVLPSISNWPPGGWTYICSPKKGQVSLYLWADKRCYEDVNPFGWCENPTTCP